MATLYRCSQGHLWEDLLDTPSMVEGQVRCPLCGRASQPTPAPAKDSRGSTLLSPAVNASAKGHIGPTRVMTSVPPTDPMLSGDQTPPPSASLATVVKPALAANSSARPAESVDIEVTTPPRAGLPSSHDRTSEVEVAPFLLPPGELTRSVEAPPEARPTSRKTVRDDRRTSPETPSSKVKPTIPGYEILDELGRGGMGVVYKARQKGLNRLVALKMILAGSNADERERARFTTEAEAIARLQHPNIVQIFEVGEISGSAWFSLEFVDGGSLADRLKGDALPVHESARLIETLARAVHFAHQHGVVHRDLKPANVLLQKESREESSGEREGSRKTPATSDSASAVTAVATLTPKLTDFGLAKTLDTDIHHTRSGMVVGTPGYMAPEQATGGDNVGPATDTYALGVILYQLVTGKLPFVGESPMEVMLKLTQEEPPRPRKWQPKLAADLETIILKCLEKDPKRRYASALDLGEDLRRFQAHEPILARPVQPVERVVRWVKRRPAVTALIAALVLAGVGLLATLAVYERGEKMRQTQEREQIESQLRKARNSTEVGTPTTATWENVRELLTDPARLARKDPALAKLADEVDELLDKAKGYLGANETFTRFTGARDAALFHATLSSGSASQAQLDATRGKVENALASIGASKSDLPAPGNFFSKEQKDEIFLSSYELLLVLADTLAQPLPNEQALAQSTKARAALDVLETAAKLLPEGTTAYHLRKARFLKAAGEPNKAVKEETRAEGLEPRTDMDFYLVGTERYRQGDVKGAEEFFFQALRKNPGHFWARFYQALCHVRQGQLIAARDTLTNCLAQHKGELRIYLLRGFVQGQLRQFDEAAADFAVAEAALKKMTPPDREMLYTLYNNRAVTYLGLKKYNESIADLKAAQGLAPDQYQAYITLSQVYRRAGDSKLAMETLDKGLDKAEKLFDTRMLDVGTYQLLRRLRWALSVEGKDSVAALAELDRLIGLQGLRPEAQARALRDRGILLHKSKQFDQALTAYNQALAAYKQAGQPPDVDLERRRGEVFLLVQPPQYEEAAKAFTRYLEAGKGSSDLNVFRGRAFARMKLKQYPEAIGDFTQALSLKIPTPADRSELYLQRGHAYFGSSAWEPAAKDFEAALQGATPTNARAALQGRALARLQLGQYQKAARDAEDLAKTAARPGAAGGNPEDAWQPLYQAACILAQVAGQVDPGREQGPAGTLPKRGAGRDERRRYQDAATGLLQQALAEMPRDRQAGFWQETVRKQSALSPLSTHEAYIRLDKRYP